MIGWMMRGIPLGAKLDECPQCHVIGPHILIRKSHWFSVLRLPVVLLWLQHGLLCPECGYWTPLSFLATRRALAAERLPLERERPRLHEGLSGGIDAAPEDWRALGVEPGAPVEAVQASYHRLAKQVHPDRGGSNRAFAALSAAYQRVTAAVHRGSRPMSDAELEAAVEPVVVNPHRGGFDLYLKVWPLLVAAIIAFAILMPRQFAGLTGSPEQYGAAHTCWSDTPTGELTGCRLADGSMAGHTGTYQLVCYFDEPVLANSKTRCR